MTALRRFFLFAAAWNLGVMFINIRVYRAYPEYMQIFANALGHEAMLRAQVVPILVSVGLWAVCSGPFQSFYHELLPLPKVQ